MNYFRRFCKDYSSIASPLFKLAVVDKKNFIWTDEAQAAFDELKVRLSNPPILALPREDDTFILTTDAAEKAIGCVLTVEREGEDVPLLTLAI